MKRAFRFSVHAGRSPRTNRLHYFSFPVPSLYRKINGITVYFLLANRSNPGFRCRSLSKFVAPRPLASRVAATVTTRLALRTRRRKYLVARWIASLRSQWTESAGGDRADAGGALYSGLASAHASSARIGTTAAGALRPLRAQRSNPSRHEIFPS